MDHENCLAIFNNIIILNKKKVKKGNSIENYIFSSMFWKTNIWKLLTLISKRFLNENEQVQKG